MNEQHKAFLKERKAEIEKMSQDEKVTQATQQWFNQTYKHRYSYNFSWMGRPIIQYPQDIIAMQEIIWHVKPDLIIETGIAHGGSIIFYASMLALLNNNGKVIGIDIDIRPHNKSAIEAHPMYKNIELIQGSSIDAAVAEQVASKAKNAKTILVVLDSNHTEAHVLQELDLYAKYVTKGSYMVVFDTVVEHLPDDTFPDRPWAVGDNPMTAVSKFLKTNDRFEIDHKIDNKLLVSVAPKGYLRCIAD